MHKSRTSARRVSFKPLLEDALEVLKGPLYNPDTKDFKKIVSVMKNCHFFRDNFSSQVALSDFVELAKFYVNYEVHQYGTILLHDKAYADKLYVILDGTVEKIFQKPYGEVEEQIKVNRRGQSFSGFEAIPLKGKPFFPSIKSPKAPVKFDDHEESAFACPLKRVYTSKTNSCSDQSKKIQRRPSQEFELAAPSQGDEVLEKSSTALEELMKFLVDKKPEMKMRYFTEEILRAEKVKTLNTGDSFGESFCVANHPKSNFMYAVSSSEAHLLTLSKEDYNEIMKQLEDRNYKKLEAFLKLFPSYEKKKIRRFSEYFSQKSFQADEVIYFQGASAQHLCIVQSGEVQFLRKFDAELREKEGSSLIPIASVVKDQAFGEECLLSMANRQETAIASACNTTVFVLKASLISELEKEFKDIFAELRKGAEEKFDWRQEKAQELFEKSESSPISSSDCLFSPIRDIAAKSLFNPRHSIQIPNRRSFLLEKGSIQSDSSTNLPSSPTALFLKASSRKLSDEQPDHQIQKSELYKSRFRRTSVISDISQITRPGEKVNYIQANDISPGSDLKTINFRSDLYGRKSSLKRIECFEKPPTSSQLSPDSQKNLETVWKKHSKRQNSLKTFIIKRALI